MPNKEFYTSEELLKPVDFGTPVSVEKIYQYLTNFDAVNLPWFEDVTVLDHIANVAYFSTQIAQKAKENGTLVDVHNTWIMGWLRDIGRVAWGIAAKEELKEIIQNYGHHGYLGYKLLINSGVPEELARIAMTHMGGGISASEIPQVNKALGKEILPAADWYAKSLEEKIVVIADKIPGWNNTIVSHYEAQKRGDLKGNKIYSWVEDQGPLWERFWSFKKDVDEACGQDVLTLFDQELLASIPEAYKKLPKPSEIASMEF